MQAVTSAQMTSVDLAESYRRVRNRTEELCEPLEIEDYIPQPIVDVSPPKWNIAHTTWFFEEMILKKFAPNYQVFDPSFSFLFNSYYNSIGDRTARDHRGDLSRPTVKRIFDYRKYVDHAMLDLLGGEDPQVYQPDRTDFSTLSSLQKEFYDLVVLGLNHEQQHQELFITDLKYTFAQNPLFPVYKVGFETHENEISNTGSIDIPSGVYEIGHTGSEFCFDNELGRQKVFINDFSISDRLVTNREFLEFVGDGGYRDHTLWHSEGWDWINRENVSSPLYWHFREGEWFHYTLGGLEKLPVDAPVCHVSFYEAAAFAEWSGMRLPTEFEWEVANSKFDWGKRWEWTGSAYLPYPGFSKAAGAVGEYNGKFMINQMVLRGSSIATPEGHSRPTYRNFFHPHLRWQFTGVRLVK